MVFEQFVPAPRHDPPSRSHAASVVSTHVMPSRPLMQHAPVTGGVQIVLSHAEPAPRHVPPSRVHAASVAITHVIAPFAWMQHAPVGAG